MILELLQKEFSVCRLDSEIKLPDGIIFMARTDNELSLVCETDNIDFGTQKREDEWRCFRVAGELDFSLIGILARITAILADAGVSVFCTSTYDTDYIMVKSEKLLMALEALSTAGYTIRNI
jgi:hypothetical protein